jgi:hypothetical protein
MSRSASYVTRLQRAARWVAMSGYEWLCVTMGGYEWLCVTMGGYEWLCVTMGGLGDYVPICIEDI